MNNCHIIVEKINSLRKRETVFAIFIDNQRLSCLGQPIMQAASRINDIVESEEHIKDTYIVQQRKKMITQEKVTTTEGFNTFIAYIILYQRLL